MGLCLWAGAAENGEIGSIPHISKRRGSLGEATLLAKFGVGVDLSLSCLQGSE